MTPDTKRPSTSVEDYLKAVFSLTRAGSPAANSALAQQLGIAPASVTGMVKRLARRGLLEHIPYQGVRLTSEGNRLALRVIRRHRIIETYLTDRLGYTWEEVHDEAERLEHTASDRLIEAMAQALGNPERDPHGAPIPSAEGTMEPASLLTLESVPLAKPHIIQAVRDEDPADLQRMEASGLVPGASVQVLARPAGAALQVGVGPRPGRPTSVPAPLARRIFVLPAS